MPDLPVELIDLIFDEVIQDVRINKKGLGACALMHVCLAARARVVRAMEPLIVSHHATKSHARPGNRWTGAFDAYFTDLLQSLVQDFSTYRVEGKQQPQPPPPIPDSSDSITTEMVPQPDTAKFNFWVTGVPSGEMVSCPLSGERRREPNQPLRMRDATAAFERALVQAMGMFNKCKPFERARSGVFEASPQLCRIYLAVELQQRTGRNATLSFKRMWDIRDTAYVPAQRWR